MGVEGGQELHFPLRFPKLSALNLYFHELENYEHMQCLNSLKVMINFIPKLRGFLCILKTLFSFPIYHFRL